MKRYFLLGAVVSSLAIAAACSSSSSTDDGGTTDASNDVTQQNDSSKTDSGGTDGGGADSATTDSGNTDASNQLTLKIDNYLAWCSVTVNGGSANTSATQTYHFGPDASVMLHGDTKSAQAFYWGYWGNVNDAGVLTDGGMDLDMDVDFNITSNVELHACCPDNGQPLTQCTF